MPGQPFQRKKKDQTLMIYLFDMRLLKYNEILYSIEQPAYKSPAFLIKIVPEEQELLDYIRKHKRLDIDVRRKRSEDGSMEGQES